MQKLAIISAAILAANAAKTVTTYNTATYDCYEYSATTEAFAIGTYASVFAILTDVTNTAGTKYNHAFDVTLDGTSTTKYECDLVFKQAWSVEWTESTADALSSGNMFDVTYESWAVNTAMLCTGTSAGSTSTVYVSAAEKDVSDTVCAYSVNFEYLDGADSSSNVIEATTQKFTVYSDNAVVAAASFAAAGVAAMFF